MNSICTQDLAVVLGHKEVLRHINIQIKKGMWTSIVGPNGSGKTTLLKVLAGLQACKGAVTFPGFDTQHPSRLQKAQYLAWMGQEQAGGDELSVYDVAMLGRIPHRSWLSAPSQKDHQAVKKALQMTHAWDWRYRRLGELSGGERQRVLLARVLAVESEIVLMDEPLSHLDPPHQVDWLHLVKQLVAEHKTVVSVLHEVSMALLSDEILVMDQGQIRHQGLVSDRLTHQAIERVFGNRIQIQHVAQRWVALPLI
jgi:iron complex transport system ATP-binding protein